MLTVEIDIEDVVDNMVGLLSQIGWTENAGDTPNEKIDMEKIVVYVDTDGDNSLISRLHSKIPHREKVIEKVIEFINY